MKTQIRTGTAMTRGIKFAMSCLFTAVVLAWTQQAGAATEEKPTVMVSLSQLNTEIRTLRENLSRTIAALVNVKAAANKNGDLLTPFANLSRQWTQFETQVAKVRQDGIATRAPAKEHWQASHTELVDMQNPKLRDKAEKRYASTTKEFEKIS